MDTSRPLIGGAALAARLDDPDVLVYDCRFAGTPAASRECYETGHIPGAVHVYWLDELCAADTTVTTLLPDEQQATDALGRLGVSERTHVVAYADAGNLYAARLWHVLTHYGHDEVMLLDGGIEKWNSEGRPLERAVVEPRPAAFRARASDWQRGVTAAEILERLEDPDCRLVDVRGPAEFSGAERRAARGGHIPGAILWPWDANLHPDGTLRSGDEIRARAHAAGLRPDQELITYCQGGVRAAHAALALRAAGYERVRIYDGSWAQWGNDPELPVGTVRRGRAQVGRSAAPSTSARSARRSTLPVALRGSSDRKSTSRGCL